jgi:hypothetical protein
MGQLLRAGQRRAARHHLVDQADALGLTGVDPAPGDDQLHGAGESHHQRKASRQPVAAHDVPTALQRAELRVLGGDPDVGQQRGLQSGGECVPVDGGDDRLEHVDAAGVAAGARVVVQAGAEAVEVADLLQCGRLAEVPAGAERRLAGAGDHQHEGVVVVAEALPGVMELLRHRPVDRVVLVGPRVDEPQSSDMATASRSHRWSWTPASLVGWVQPRLRSAARTNKGGPVRRARKPVETVPPAPGYP